MSSVGGRPWFQAFGAYVGCAGPGVHRSHARRVVTSTKGNAFLPILLLFILLPLIEIALFIAVGGQIGLGATLALIVLSALVGSSILRGQQAQATAMMQGARHIQPGTFLAKGAFRVLAGILLIIPGFLTDTFGLILLIPPLQRAIVRAIGARATVVTTRVWQDGDVVEGEYSVRNPARDPLGPDRRLDDSRH